MREPAKKDPTRRGIYWRVICKEINRAKGATNERRYVWMPFNKIKNKEAPYALLTKEIITKSYLYNA